MRRFAAILSLTALTIVLAPSAAAGGGCHWQTDEWTADSSSASEVTAHIAGCRFEPTTLQIQPGTTVTWLNKDPAPHSVTGPFLTIGSDKMLNQGDSVSFTFDEEGVYPYYCVFHPGMAASVVVGSPDIAVTGVVNSDGSYEASSGAYNESAPIRGDSEPTTSDSSLLVPVAASIGGLALVAATGLLIRRRRRALPVPTALP